jgi:hypothetical protein
MCIAPFEKGWVIRNEKSHILFTHNTSVIHVDKLVLMLIRVQVGEEMAFILIAPIKA